MKENWKKLKTGRKKGINQDVRRGLENEWKKENKIKTWNLDAGFLKKRRKKRIEYVNKKERKEKRKEE